MSFMQDTVTHNGPRRGADKTVRCGPDECVSGTITGRLSSSQNIIANQYCNMYKV